MITITSVPTSIGSPLINLALLETLKSEKFQDEIDLFLPFIAVTIREIGKPVIDINDIQAKLSELFGFRPPLSAIKALTSRAKRRGLLIQENYALIPRSEKIAEWSNGYEQKREDLIISLASLKSGLIDFTLDRFRKDLSPESAENLIFNFIESNVSAAVSQRAYTKAEFENSIKNTDHVIASFISHIHRREPVLLDHFSRCVKGMLLARYLYFADNTTRKKTFDKITVYLDSPLILGLLGFNGTINRQAQQEFIHLLRSLKIEIFVFDRTLDEIERLLSAWKADIAKKSYGRFNTKTLELLRAQGYDEARLDTEIKTLQRSIENFGITIKYGFSAKERYQCNENELEAAISVNFHKNKNLEHDTVCISRVHNQREGRYVKDLNEQFSVFVTGNTGLAKYANGFFSKNNYRTAIPVVVSEQWLTILFWLKSPDISNKLPTDQIVATAYSLLYTDDKFWDAFLARMEAVKRRGEITEEEFIMVRWDADLLKTVQDASVDVGEDFSEEDIFEIVEKIKSKHFEDSQKEIDDVKAAAKSEIDLAALKAATVLKAERLFNEDLIKKHRAIEQKIEAIAGIVSGFIAVAISSGLLFCILVATVKTLPSSAIPSYINNWEPTTPIFITAVLTTAFWGILSWTFGIDIRKIHVGVKNWITQKVLNFFYG